jgi:dihydrofolate reductase
MKFSVFCGVSVDGFLARKDDTFDFLDAGGSEPHGFTEFMKSVDVIVMGRRTFEVVRALGHFGLYGKRRMVILSSRPLDLSSINARIEQMSGTPQQIAARLTKRGFKHAYVDGGLTIQRFIEAGLVDHITVSRVPVLIGAGVPLFGPVSRDIPLKHLSTKSFPGGLVQSRYAVRPTPKKRKIVKGKSEKGKQ